MTDLCGCVYEPEAGVWTRFCAKHEGEKMRDRTRLQCEQDDAQAAREQRALREGWLEREVEPTMNRVVVTRPVLGIYSMQVCVVADATDEEILAVCNRENPSGTTHGWGKVERTKPEPVVCADHPERRHLLVDC